MHLTNYRTPNHPVLTLLKSSALLLPGLLQQHAHAAEDDSVDFQYSHYQEGRREGIGPVTQNNAWGKTLDMDVPNRRNPIEVDSLHGSARVTLTDRINFAFIYIQDTWSGATPMGSAPELRVPTQHYLMVIMTAKVGLL